MQAWVHHQASGSVWRAASATSAAQALQLASAIPWRKGRRRGCSVARWTMAAALHRSKAVRASRPCCAKACGKPQTWQGLDAEGQQVGALAQSDQRIGDVAPVRVQDQYDRAHQGQRQGDGTQQPEQGPDTGNAACTGFQHRLPAAAEMQPDCALAQQGRQALLRIELVAARRIIDAPARRVVQQVGIDLDRPALAAADAHQMPAVEPLQLRQRAVHQPDHVVGLDAPLGVDEGLSSQRIRANRPTQPSRTSSASSRRPQRARRDRLA